MWESLGGQPSIVDQPWPQARKELLVAEEITIVFQVNGKLRGQGQFPNGCGQRYDSFRSQGRRQGTILFGGQGNRQGNLCAWQTCQPRSQRLAPLVMSRFLPENFDASRPLALIAGQGLYPSCSLKEPDRRVSLFA